jgi:hypothetical protein
MSERFYGQDLSTFERVGLTEAADGLAAALGRGVVDRTVVHRNAHRGGGPPGGTTDSEAKAHDLLPHPFADPEGPAGPSPIAALTETS